MSNVSNHNNDLSIPDGGTFFDSINVAGFAQMKALFQVKSHAWNLIFDQPIPNKAIRINSTDK
jgi:hypothetical protein